MYTLAFSHPKQKLLLENVYFYLNCRMVLLRAVEFPLILNQMCLFLFGGLFLLPSYTLFLCPLEFISLCFISISPIKPQPFRNMKCKLDNILFRQLMLQYILDYPLGKKMENHLNFFISHLE